MATNTPPWSGYTHQEAFLSSDSLSTNATISPADTTGAGRTLGIAYDVAGRALEQFINKRFASAETSGTVVPFEPDGLSLSESSANTDSTASNLIGPGRVLGLAYDAAGRVLEKHLNSIANRLGFGPSATVRTIKERWHAYLRDAHSDDPKHTLSDLSLSRSQRKMLEKRCSRLLKYASSDVVSTQIRALDSIVDLIISDPYFREVLRKFDAAKVLAEVQFQSLLWKNAEATALYRSAVRAVVSTGETKLCEISEKISHGERDVVQKAIPQLCSYLRDPEVSFMVLRYLIRHSQYFTTHMDEEEHAVTPLAIRELMLVTPELIEWSSLDVLLHECLTQFWRFDVMARRFNPSQISEVRKVWPTLLEVVFRYADRLPSSMRMIRQFCSRLEPEYLTDLTMIAFPFWLWLIFEGIAEASQTSTDTLSYLPEDLIAMYPSPKLIDIWRVLLCPPIVIYREVLLERRRGFLFGDGITWIPDSGRFGDLCRELASYLKLGIEYNREQAVRCVNAVLQLDRYCNRTMSQALSEVVPEVSVSDIFRRKLRYLRDMSKQGKVYRHKLSDGRAHLRLWEFCKHDECDICFLEEASEDELGDYSSDMMIIQDTDVLWLQVEPGIPFRRDDHIPVLAGKSSSGDEQYIAGVPEDPRKPLAGWSEYRLCTVSYGDTKVEYLDLDDFDVKRTSRFAVLVMRFDLEVYPITDDDGEDGHGNERIDATGPLFWRPIVNHCTSCT